MQVGATTHEKFKVLPFKVKIQGLALIGDMGIANRARWLSTPEARSARPNCNDSRIRVPTVCRYV
jgi:hypothetical protein